MKKTVFLFFALGFCMFLIAPLSSGDPAKTPETVKLDSISEKYEPVVFNHAKHILLAGDCGKCHHQHGNNSSLSCKECHSLSPSTFKSSVSGNFMACRNCHNTFSPDNPGMPGLKTAYHTQCFQCHRGMGDIGTDPKGCAKTCHSKKEQKKVGMNTRK